MHVIRILRSHFVGQMCARSQYYSCKIPIKTKSKHVRKVIPKLKLAFNFYVIHNRHNIIGSRIDLHLRIWKVAVKPFSVLSWKHCIQHKQIMTRSQWRRNLPRNFRMDGPLHWKYSGGHVPNPPASSACTHKTAHRHNFT